MFSDELGTYVTSEKILRRLVLASVRRFQLNRNEECIQSALL